MNVKTEHSTSINLRYQCTPFAIDAMPRRTRVRTPTRPAPSTDSQARVPRSRARTPSAPRRPVRHSRGTLRALLAYRDAFAVDRRAWPVLRLRPRYPATRVDGRSRRNLASDASKVARDG